MSNRRVIVVALLLSWRDAVRPVAGYLIAGNAWARLNAITYLLVPSAYSIAPIRAPATTLSLFAALFGLFYTAVVVSVFVGLAQSAKDGRRR